MSRFDAPAPATASALVRFPLLLGLLLIWAGACGGDGGGPVSAGAGRDAPADGGSVNFDGPDTGTNGPDNSPTPDVSTEPIDRVLREGAVGTVTVVTDGDTVHVTVNGWYHRVRIQGINAPECHKSLTNTTDGRQYICSSDDEYWGLAASEAFEERALGATVTVICDQSPGQPCPIDTFDRPLAFLEDDEGDLGEWMARNGHAFSFTKFSSTRRATYCDAEDRAIADRLGMWALGSRDDVLDRMSDGTQDWYADRDRRCDEVTQ